MRTINRHSAGLTTGSSGHVQEEIPLLIPSGGAIPLLLNVDGQIPNGSPIRSGTFMADRTLVVDRMQNFRVLVRTARLDACRHAHHPFDVVGWDGFVYPFTFNAQDFEPITGTVHQPPPIHQTFEIRGYVVCTFAPRLLDTHPEAVKIPWVHDNVEADEVLFYVRGNFGSRKGIEAGSITLHPRGIPHGPHPGTIMASKDATRTEVARMFDTNTPRNDRSHRADDEKYPLSGSISQGILDKTRTKLSGNRRIGRFRVAARHGGRVLSVLPRDSRSHWRDRSARVDETPGRAARAFEFLTAAIGRV